jgi:acyl dehydratase
MISYAEVEVGTELPAITVPATRLGLVQYAGASGDFNPIHTQESFAKLVGLPDVIAHGMFTMGAASRVLTAWTGDPGAIRSYAVRFSSPVVVPDGFDGARIEVAGKVTEKLEGNVVKVALEVTVDGSKVLLGAVATLALP